VWIAHFPFGDRSLQLERSGLVEFRRKPVMRERWSRRHKQTNQYE
jgi:hypothetical protein